VKISKEAYGVNDTLGPIPRSLSNGSAAGATRTTRGGQMLKVLMLVCSIEPTPQDCQTGNAIYVITGSRSI
jgi:hypothetical protein